MVCSKVGRIVGVLVGRTEGLVVGKNVGDAVGVFVWRNVGSVDGLKLHEGTRVGLNTGILVGAKVLQVA